MNRKVVPRLLEAMGLDVAAVSSGQKAVEGMRAEAVTIENSIAILFMDVQKPDMDGMERPPAPLSHMRSEIPFRRDCFEMRGQYCGWTCCRYAPA
jgi:DNA-binding NtrC family response regulator